LFGVCVIRWFWGIERFLEPWMVEEMYGVSKYASKEFDTTADPLTRQVAYHGLHEVGQMMVDVGVEDFGCTVVAFPQQGSWVIGRNFDFDGGRFFDSEKVMKWVFPDRGYPFVSVIWAGLVGAVTGVNDRGVYISINAAGSTDFRRYGTPSTLILLKALQFSKDAEEAVRTIERERMFATDIFVVADRNGKLYRVEKSPRHTEIIPLQGASVVTNHLAGTRWANDSINVYRRDELTSAVREARGNELLAAVQNERPKDQVSAVLVILRDKSAPGGKPLPIGNRKAIDALIAKHSVIYDSAADQLFVSKGPALAGPFVGFDLEASFRLRQPSVVRTLPADPAVSADLFERVRSSAHLVSGAERLVQKGECKEAEILMGRAGERYSGSSDYYAAVGDVRKCFGDDVRAKEAWRKAIELSPAYPKKSRELSRRLGR
jgi:hypothetical protein